MYAPIEQKISANQEMYNHAHRTIEWYHFSHYHPNFQRHRVCDVTKKHENKAD